MEINFPVFTGDLSIQWSAEVTIKTLKKKRTKKKTKVVVKRKGKMEYYMVLTNFMPQDLHTRRDFIGNVVSCFQSKPSCPLKGFDKKIILKEEIDLPQACYWSTFLLPWSLNKSVTPAPCNKSNTFFKDDWDQQSKSYLLTTGPILQCVIIKAKVLHAYQMFLWCVWSPSTDLTPRSMCIYP